MVMKTPKATPRLRGPQRRMVLVGDRGPMWHREGWQGEGQAKRQRQLCSHRRCRFEIGGHSPGLFAALVESAP